jgi:hypothetical protein
MLVYSTKNDKLVQGRLQQAGKKGRTLVGRYMVVRFVYWSMGDKGKGQKPSKFLMGVAFQKMIS